MNKKKAIKREFSEQAVTLRMHERKGTRYQSAQLANYFGIPTARMTEVLRMMAAKKKIRCVRTGGNPTMYYVPTQQQLEAEAKLPVTVSTVVIIKMPETVE